MQVLKQQYLTIKANYNDAILLFRVGDYYESFGEDAKVIAEILGIKLTEVQDSDLKFNASFPYLALDSYLHKLVKKKDIASPFASNWKIPKKQKEWSEEASPTCLNE